MATPVKEAIVKTKSEGQTDRAVAQLFGVNHRTVGRIFKRNQQCGDVSRKAKSGRPRKTTKREERTIIGHINADPNRTAADASSYAQQNFGTKISIQTARRILRRYGLHARRPARTPLLKKRHRLARLMFARRHKMWGREEWGRVLWSDETKINLFNPDGSLFVRRPVGTRFEQRYTKGTVKFQGGNIMVWGKINQI